MGTLTSWRDGPSDKGVDYSLAVGKGARVRHYPAGATQAGQKPMFFLNFSGCRRVKRIFSARHADCDGTWR